ncbi:MAG: KEOPS complex subunit Cgi121 [Candidatus Micrarchaeota archaeon]
MVTVLGVRTKEKSTKELFEKLVTLSKKHSLILQAFDPDSIVSPRHLAYTFELASRSFQSKTNVARSFETELLLRAAGTEKIDEAIERVGVKSPSQILLFSNLQIPGSLLKGFGEEDSSLLKLTTEKKKKIARLFKIKEKELGLYPLEELVLERLAIRF